jgi:hypothetical protein
MADLFVCSRRDSRPSCRHCGKRTDRTCTFALRGKLEGQRCAAPVCEGCGGPDGMCQPHQRLERANSGQQTADDPDSDSEL